MLQAKATGPYSKFTYSFNGYLNLATASASPKEGLKVLPKGYSPKLKIGNPDMLTGFQAESINSSSGIS